MVEPVLTVSEDFKNKLVFSPIIILLGKMSNIESLWKNWTNSNYDTETKWRHTKTKAGNEWNDFTNSPPVRLTKDLYEVSLGPMLMHRKHNHDHPDDIQTPTEDAIKDLPNDFINSLNEIPDVNIPDDPPGEGPIEKFKKWLKDHLKGLEKDIEIGLVVVGVVFLGLGYVAYENREAIGGYAKSAKNNAVKYGKYAALL